MKSPIKILIAIVILGAILRLPGLFWGLASYDVFQPDEPQHVGIALNLLNSIDDNLVGDQFIFRQFNGPGFGTQVALLSYLPLKLFNLNIGQLFLIARLLSYFYSLALIVLVFYLALKIFKSHKLALVSAFFISIFDLNVTYSHYGLPDIALVFWSCLSLYLIIKFIELEKKSRSFLVDNFWLMICLSLSMSMSFIFKFDVIPIIIFVLAIFYQLLNNNYRFNLLKSSLLIVLFFVLFFYLGTGFVYGIDDLIYSKQILTNGNMDVIVSDNHILNNPILYLSAIIAGTSLPISILAVIAIIILISGFNNDSKNHKVKLIFIFIFIIFEFLILWSGDSTFVRRANIFLPFVAILAGYGFIKLSDLWHLSKIKSLIFLAIIIIYTLSLTVISQSNFVYDTRYLAKGYLNSELKNNKNICYSGYAFAMGMPGDYNYHKCIDSNMEFLVIHETYYSRYAKSFTTPFKIPSCCDEVHHCNYNWCLAVQDVFSNRSDYHLVKKFTLNRFFPEREIFYNLYGNYETFLGDLLIYQKNNI